MRARNKSHAVGPAQHTGGTSHSGGCLKPACTMAARANTTAAARLQSARQESRQYRVRTRTATVYSTGACAAAQRCKCHKAAGTRRVSMARRGHCPLSLGIDTSTRTTPASDTSRHQGACGVMVPGARSLLGSPPRRWSLLTALPRRKESEIWRAARPAPAVFTPANPSDDPVPQALTSRAAGGCRAFSPQGRWASVVLRANRRM